MAVDKNLATALVVGDIILDAPDADRFFDLSRETLKAGDVVIGNIETPHTDRPMWCNFEPHSAPPSDPENLHAVAKAGFNIATIGGNHCFDQGAYGILDPIDILNADGVLTCGAGANIHAARKPAVIEKKGITFAVLHYNLTGPTICYASAKKTGAAYVRIVTHYENDRAGYGESPSSIYTVPDPRTTQNMKDDIKKAKEIADIVLVYFHGGRAGDPHIMSGESLIAHIAVDAGAEGIIFTHSHALSGYEVYEGKPIYYGTGNFVTVTGAMNADADNAEQRRTDPFAWPDVTPYWEFDPFAKSHPKDVHYYPFSDDSRNTIIAKMTFDKTGIKTAGYIPCYINRDAQPEPLTRENGGQSVVDYLDAWIAAGSAGAPYRWNEDGTEILFDL